VARIVYGAADPKGGAAGSVVDLSALPGVNHRVAVRGGVRAEEAARLLQAFFRARRAGDTS
jgi:tRNA(adenine34) deaminase